MLLAHALPFHETAHTGGPDIWLEMSLQHLHALCYLLYHDACEHLSVPKGFPC